MRSRPVSSARALIVGTGPSCSTEAIASRIGRSRVGHFGSAIPTTLRPPPASRLGRSRASAWLLGRRAPARCPHRPSRGPRRRRGPRGDGLPARRRRFAANRPGTGGGGEVPPRPALRRPTGRRPSGPGCAGRHLATTLRRFIMPDNDTPALEAVAALHRRAAPHPGRWGSGRRPGPGPAVASPAARRILRGRRGFLGVPG